MALKKTATARAPRGAKVAKSSGGLRSVLMGAIRKKTGDSSVVLASDPDLKINGVYSTRAPGLDRAIGRGGIPWGRLTVLWGGEGSGKTTILLQSIAEVQSLGGEVVLIDAEHKLDPEYAEELEVRLDDLLYVRPHKLEDVVDQIKVSLDTIQFFRRKKSDLGVPAVIALDSIGGVKAATRIATNTGDKSYPAEAQIWADDLPWIIDKAKQTDTSLLFVSQVRKKMNARFGDPNELPGGGAIKHHASLVVFVTKTGTVYLTTKGKKVKVGSEIEVNCKKNQISKPYQRASLRLLWHRGIDYEHSLFSELEAAGSTSRCKGGFTWNGELVETKTKSVVGAAKELRRDPELRAEMVMAFRQLPVFRREDVIDVYGEEADEEGPAGEGDEE